MKHKIKKNRLKIFIALSMLFTMICSVFALCKTYAYQDQFDNTYYDFNQIFNTTNYNLTRYNVNINRNSSSNTITISTNGIANSNGDLPLGITTYIPNHTYFMHYLGSISNISLIIQQTNGTTWVRNKNTYAINNLIFNYSETDASNLNFVVSFTNGSSPSASLQFELFDLTQMFGEGNEPTTINETRTYFNLLGINLDEYQRYTTSKKLFISNNSNTDYQQLTNDLQELDENYNNLEDNYTELNDNYTQLESDYNDLQNNYDNLENDYNDLYEDFNNISTYSSEGAFTYLISTKTYNAQHPQNNVMTKSKDELIAQGYLDQDTFNIYNLPRPTIYEGNAKQIWINFGYYENANRYRYVDYKFLDFTFDYNVNAFQGQVYDYFGNEDYQHLRSNFVEIAFVNYEMINYNVNDITNYYSVLTISQEDLYKFNNVLNIDNLKELYPNFNFEYYNSLFYIQTYFIYDINNQELHYTIRSNNIQTNYFYNQGYNAGQNNQYNIDRTQIQLYQNEIKDLKSQINTLQQEINILNGQVETLTNDDYNLNNLMWTIGSVPFESFKQIWNVNFFGVNLADFFLGFVTFFIALFVVKKFFL